MGLTQLAQKVHPDADIVWQPNAGSQTHFVECPFWEALYDGNRGPGKSDALLMAFAQHVGKGWGRAWRGVIFRKQYKNLEELKVKGKRFFFAAFPGCKFLEAKSDYKFVWPTGEELLLRALEKDDDYWNYHGHEFPYIGFDELTTWPTDYLYEAMKSCSRSSVPGLPKLYRSTTNPYGPGHGWCKSYWYDPAPGYDPTGIFIRNPHNGQIRARYTGDLYENKRLIESSPEYVQQLESIKNPALRLAWRFGNWDIMVGGFWDGVWNPDLHIVDNFTPPVSWRHWRSMDWGYAAPYSVNWFAKSPEGQVIMYRELYGWGGKENHGSRESAKTVAKRILEIDAFERKYGVRFQMNPADDQIWQGHGTERTIADSFTEEGVIWMPAKKGKDSRVNGWNAVREALETRIAISQDGGERAGASKTAQADGEKPGFVVTRNCKHFLRTFPILMPDEDNWEDVDTEQEDHAADSVRYSLFSRHRAFRRKEPEHDRRREKELPKPRIAGDPQPERKLWPVN